MDDIDPEITRHFMAGILNRMRDITVFLNTTSESYLRFGENEGGGVGQGDGEVGDVLGAKPEDGKGEAGKDPGEHTIEAEVTVDELAQILNKKLK